MLLVLLGHSFWKNTKNQDYNMLYIYMLYIIPTGPHKDPPKTEKATKKNIRSKHPATFPLERCVLKQNSQTPKHSFKLLATSGLTPEPNTHQVYPHSIPIGIQWAGYGFLWSAQFFGRFSLESCSCSKNTAKKYPLRHHKKMNKFKYSSLHLFLRK